MRTTAVIAIALGCTMAGAGTAEAQFKIGKIIKNQAATAAASAAGVSPTATGSVRTGPVKFDDRVLEITAPRIAQLIKGLDAEIAMAAKVDAQDVGAIDRENEAAERAYDKAYEAYSKKDEAYEACAQKQSKKMEDEAGPAPGADQMAAMHAVGARVQAAQAKGDRAEVMRLTDSLSKAVQSMTSRMTSVANGGGARVTSACGVKPEAPKSPVRKAALTYNDVQQAGSVAAGLDGGQYRILRERIAPFVATKGQSSGMVYTAAEVDAMRAAMDALGQRGTALQRY